MRYSRTIRVGVKHEAVRNELITELIISIPFTAPNVDQQQQRMDGCDLYYWEQLQDY